MTFDELGEVNEEALKVLEEMVAKSPPWKNMPLASTLQSKPNYLYDAWTKSVSAKAWQADIAAIKSTPPSEFEATAHTTAPPLHFEHAVDFLKGWPAPPSTVISYKKEAPVELTKYDLILAGIDTLEMGHVFKYGGKDYMVVSPPDKDHIVKVVPLDAMTVEPGAVKDYSGGGPYAVPFDVIKDKIDHSYIAKLTDEMAHATFKKLCENDWMASQPVYGKSVLEDEHHMLASIAKLKEMMDKKLGPAYATPPDLEIVSPYAKEVSELDEYIVKCQEEMIKDVGIPKSLYGAPVVIDPDFMGKDYEPKKLKAKWSMDPPPAKPFSPTDIPGCIFHLAAESPAGPATAASLDADGIGDVDSSPGMPGFGTLPASAMGTITALDHSTDADGIVTQNVTIEFSNELWNKPVDKLTLAEVMASQPMMGQSIDLEHTLPFRVVRSGAAAADLVPMRLRDPTPEERAILDAILCPVVDLVVEG